MQNEKPWRMSKSEVLNQYQSSENGLTQDQVNEKLEKYGHNEISKKKVRGGILIFIEQFKNPLVLILIGASIIAAFLGELTDALIIISIVMLNGFLGFYQEYKSEQALEQLKKFISFTASVRRNGEEQQINTRELVPGDIVRLEMGDVVPADIRLLDVDDLTIDESSLTGESYPVRKVSSKIPIESPSMHEMKNIAFMGTNVKSGTSLGIITTTGKNTFFGKTAQLLKKIKKESEFQKT